MARNKDSLANTFIVATLLCIVCSVLVSMAAVMLRPIQEKNKDLDRKKNILMAGGLMVPGESVDKLFEDIETKLVDLSTGDSVNSMDPANFNAKKLEKDPEKRVLIPSKKDLAGIKVRAPYSLVYLIKGDTGVEGVILPVHGKGLWSTMYGFLALESDLTTVKGFAFYQHGETPGLGGEVDNPRWKQQWVGKKVFGENWEVKAKVAKGAVNKKSPAAIHQVDGLSGATITANGVTQLVRYWLGDHGYGKYLKNLKTQIASGSYTE